MAENAPTLPGMNSAGQSPNTMALAAAEYIESLRAQNLIQPHHVLTVQLVLGLAEVIGKAAAKGQAAAMSLAAKQLMEAMDTLPQPVAAGDAFQQFLDSLKDDPATMEETR